MNIQFFIFDWSGTISDDRHPVYKANVLMRKFYGIEETISFEEWLQSSAISVVQSFQDKGVQASAEEISALYKRSFNEIIAKEARPVVYPDAQATLERLQTHGARMAVISAHPEYNLKKRSQYIWFNRFF